MQPDINVRGYSYNGVSFSVTEDMPSDILEKIKGKGSVPGLHLRDYVLDGGEIHMTLSDANRVESDPGYWYAAKCERWSLEKQTEDRVGTILLRQMSVDDKPRKTIELALEDLDNGHILDRLIGETLNFHADTVGPGPLGQKPTKRLKMS